MASRDAGDRVAARTLLLEMGGKIEAARKAIDDKDGRDLAALESLVEASSSYLDEDGEGALQLLELSEAPTHEVLGGALSDMSLKLLQKELNKALKQGIDVIKGAGASKAGVTTTTATTSAAGEHKTERAADVKPKATSKRTHLSGCYNRTAATVVPASSSAGYMSVASLPRYVLAGEGTCVDFRTDVCDCEGAEQSMPQRCAMAVAEVKTPGVLIFAAFGAAALVVSGVVAVQVSYARDSCARGRDKQQGTKRHRNKGTNAGSNSKGLDLPASPTKGAVTVPRQ